MAGNHDFVFQDGKQYLDMDNLPFVYLEDSGVELAGKSIWGSPWQPVFFDWAFNAEESFLEHKWSLIPDNTDILLLHGPPHKYGDLTFDRHYNTGSPSLTRKIKEVKPKLVVCGHIHASRGIYAVDDSDITIINASIVNENYEPVYKPFIWEV